MEKKKLGYALYVEKVYYCVALLVDGCLVIRIVQASFARLKALDKLDKVMSSAALPEPERQAEI